MIQRFFSFITLWVLLLGWLSLPKPASDGLRKFTVASLKPVWKWTHRFRDYLGDRPFFGSHSSRPSQELSELQMEVQGLRAQLEAQSDWKMWSDHLGSRLGLLKELEKENRSEFFKRRFEEMGDLVQRQYFAVPAQVIYRDPSSWSSSLWIQVGEKENEALGRTVIAKNSPVVVGSSLVGVVEFVGERQSRVRLITDSGLILSVRTARGSLQNRELSQLITTVYDRLQARKDLPLTGEEKELFLNCLSRLGKKSGGEDGYYAKGQLQGSSASFWRARGLILKGMGFNYDYPDAEGPARELRTGRPVGSNGSELPLLKEGDLLFTSGLDGVFPPGLQAAVVTSISGLNQGGYSYELEARPTAVNLNDLRMVFVLPPLASDQSE